MKDFEYASWYGLFVPAGTPLTMINKLHHAAIIAMESPDVAKIYEAKSLNATPMSPDAIAKYIAAEKWNGCVSSVKRALSSINRHRLGINS